MQLYSQGGRNERCLRFILDLFARHISMKGFQAMHTSITFAATSAILLASQALAGMMGSQISATLINGNAITGSLPTGSTVPSESFTATVTNNIEYQVRVSPSNRPFGYDVDISDSAIRINFFCPQGIAVGWGNEFSPTFFYGYVFRDVNQLIPAFTGFTIGAKSDGVPYNSMMGPPWKGQLYAVDEDTLVLNLAGLYGPHNAFIEFNVATVPTTGAAILLGVAGVFVRRRR